MSCFSAFPFPGSREQRAFAELVTEQPVPEKEVASFAPSRVEKEDKSSRFTPFALRESPWVRIPKIGCIMPLTPILSSRHYFYSVGHFRRRRVFLSSPLGRRRKKRTVLVEDDGLVKKKTAWRRRRWHADEEDGLEKKKTPDIQDVDLVPT
ncbi:Hypothetical predicted protein [Cloeon dipterum]|uniref:Uncharacterized protein n=1 Tax=Cloeon dipterum TaxID=197152 RepID=A0A8S1CGP9_9INSE|nr:Hypothetical predicted protein [Cloeon dipterum]